MHLVWCGSCSWCYCWYEQCCASLTTQSTRELFSSYPEVHKPLQISLLSAGVCTASDAEDKKELPEFFHETGKKAGMDAE